MSDKPPVKKGADPIIWLRKRWSQLRPLRQVFVWAFAIYGMQQMWRAGQADETPVVLFAFIEWWNIGRDAVAAAWQWSVDAYQWVMS